jgi:hypothetical protein
MRPVNASVAARVPDCCSRRQRAEQQERERRAAHVGVRREDAEHEPDRRENAHSDQHGPPARERRADRSKRNGIQRKQHAGCATGCKSQRVDRRNHDGDLERMAARRISLWQDPRKDHDDRRKRKRACCEQRALRRIRKKSEVQHADRQHDEVQAEQRASRASARRCSRCIGCHKRSLI